MRRGEQSLTAEQRRRRNRAILADYCAELPSGVIGARHGVSARYVAMLAQRSDLSRPRGRPALWPECPPEKAREFRYLRRHLPADQARAALEQSE